MERIDRWAERVRRLAAERRLAERELRDAEVAVERARGAVEAVEAAQKIVQAVAEAVQQRVHRRIADVVTSCLRVVFGDDAYEFKVVFERKRGRTEAALVLERNGLRLTDPLNEAGGGVIDVAALGLRLACLTLKRPVVARVLFLDEPFKNVRGDAYRRRTRQLLLRLAEKMGFQFIISTDVSAYRLGTVVELSDAEEIG